MPSIHPYSLAVRILATAFLRGLLPWLLIYGFLATQLPALAGQQLPPPLAEKKVLLLYSYGHGGMGVSLFDEGFLAATNAAGVGVNNLFFEYLDLERNKEDPQYRSRLRSLLLKKYSARGIDLIVTVQQPALDFLLHEGKEIAPGVPAITAQAPMPSAAEAGNRGIVSELAYFDLAGTLARAVELFPRTRRVVLVAGSSDADRQVAAEAVRIAADRKGRLEIETTADLPLEDMLQRVASLPPQSIIIFTQYNRDSRGRVTTAYEVEEWVAKKANAPVFGLYDFNLSNGGIGGSVVAVKALGASTGQLALDLMSGKRQLTQAVTSISSVAVPMFNWAQIERWGGDRSRLPKNSVFVNREPPFWEEHPDVAMVTVVLLLLQSLMIVIMAVGRRRRRRIEQSLQESEMRYRSVTASASDAVVSADAAGNIIGWNPAAERMFGYAEAETCGRPLSLLMPERAREGHEQSVQRLAAGGIPHALGRLAELVGRRKDGSEFPMELSLAQWETSAGKFFTGIIRDITERVQQAEQTRRLLVEKETILRSVLVGIVHIKDRRIVSYNRRCGDLFGYDADELVGASTETIFDSRKSFLAIGERAYKALAEGKNFGEEVVFKRKDGSLFWGAMNGCAIDSAHPLDGSIWICADISERRKTEQNSRKLQQAVEQSPVSIVITNRDGDIEYVNPRFTAVTGYTSDEAIGHNPRILKSGETPVETYWELWRTILGGRTWRGVLRNKRKNGGLFWEEASISPILNEKGEVTHFVAVKEDITERKRIEQQLEDGQLHLEDLVRQRTAELSDALDAAKRADQAKDEFLANVSHELRTPLNVVIGLSDLARSMSKDPKQRDYMDKIADAGKHLSGIINDLLDLSKIAAGRMKFEVTLFGLRDLVQGSLSAMAHRAQGKGLHLVQRVDEQVPDVLLGDPLRLRQILLNLVSNSVKFTREGRIEVRIGVNAKTHDRVCLDIEVEDTGIGMDETDIAQLFKPFSQADASMTRKYGGTGLGLAICRRLAELMGGSIGVSSRLGSGTTFMVKIWLGLGNIADMRQPVDKDAEKAYYRNTHVLLVEDQPINREIVEQLLLAVGIVPRMASNGREALEIMSASGPSDFDLILMDIQMPEMDGLTATREIRTRLGFDEIPIIAMTAHTMDHEKQSGIEAGMNDHIGKPFETADFYRILAKWLPRIKQQELPDGIGQLPDDQGLQPISGVDTRAGLARFGGNEARYWHWLSVFVEEAPAFSAQIRSALANAQEERARKAAHAIKGRVGMLGMTDLHAIVTVLEETLRRGEPADDLLDSMQDTIAKICDELQSAFDAADSDRDASVSRRQEGAET